MTAPPTSSPISLELESEDPRVGEVISDRYQLKQLLGEGAMGKVYEAEHIMMRKRVAVKILHQELTRVPEVVARFEREAMAAANIDHPNVAAATDFGKLEDGSIFLVLEYVSGRNLRQELTAPFEVQRMLHIARQIASALSSAHGLDIVHRDLKPENVMLVEKGGDPNFVKVLDFGIAKVPIQEGPEGTTQAITKVGMVFGTPEYMAPEQALGKEVDARADLFALGVMMFEMLAGIRPWDDGELGMLGQQLSRPVPSFAERVPHISVPVPVEQSIRRMLAPDPKDRPESILEVVRELDYHRNTFGSMPGALSGSVHDGSIPDFGSIPDTGMHSMRFSGPGSIPDTNPRGSALPADVPPLSMPQSVGGVGSIPDPSLSAPGTLSSPKTAGGPLAALDNAVEPLRPRLPRKLQDMPSLALVGVPVGAFVLGIVLVVVIAVAAGGGGSATAGTSATTSAEADGPSVEPVTEPGASDEQLAEARKGGVEGLDKLAQQFPKDTKVQLELIKAHTLKQDRLAAVAHVKKALELDPKLAQEEQIATTLWVAAQDKKSRDAAFEMLTGPMKERGADIVYDLATQKRVKPAVKKRADAWLQSKDFQKNSSPALNVAVALRSAKRCEQKLALAKRAKNVGDERALTHLRTYEARSGCGKRGRFDCHPCLRKDDTLKTAIAAIEQRSKK